MMLYEAITGTESYGFTHFLESKVVSLYLEPQRDIMLGDHGPADKYSTARMYYSLATGDATAVNSLFVAKDFVSFESPTSKRLRLNRQHFMPKSYFTRVVESSMQVIEEEMPDLEKFTTPEDREAAILLRESKVLKAYCELFIARSNHQDLIIPHVQYMHLSGTKIEYVTRKSRELAKEVLEISNKYDTFIDDLLLMKILRAPYL